MTDDRDAKLANYREQIEALLATRQRYENQLALAAVVLQEALPIGQVKHIGLMEVAAGVGELAARLAVKCQSPTPTMCERLWAADRDRAQLEHVDPALADEFPFGCDTVEHLALALIAARQQRDAAQTGRRLAEEIAAGMEVERDEARKMRDALFVARDEAVKDGVFWMERCDELAEAISECGNYLFGELSPWGVVSGWRESKASWWLRCKAAVESVEKASTT